MKALGQRVDDAMRKIKEKIKGIQLNNSFLNDVAKIYERRGHSAARLYVQGKFTERMRGEEREAFSRLIDVLDILKSENVPGPISSFCIKKLNAINLAEKGGA